MPGRPRVGLVLGGGGARGAAHIGVLEVLQDLRVPVDCIAGTSMGALVTGVFASGLSPQEMRETLAKADWDDMFQDNPDFYDMSYRNKRMSQAFLPGSELGVTKEGLEYAPGVVSGQKIKAFFNELVHDDRGERLIQNLPIPISLIATNIVNGERVVMREGSLSQAMRASMSVPGLMAPVERKGAKLVDGGLVDNVPITEARERCKADIVIVVNVGSPLLQADQIGSLLSVSAQMVNILTEQNVTRSLALLKPTDIYIKPDLKGISASDFKLSDTTAQRGKDAALKVADQLKKLSVGEAQYASWVKHIEVAVPAPLTVDEIEIAGLKRVNPVDVSRNVTQQAGATLDTAVLNADLLRVYGDGYYESVDYALLRDRDRNILRVTPVEKAWGPDYLRFGLALMSDSGTGSDYSLRVGYHKTWADALGAEFLAVAEIGNRMGIAVDYYQPLDAAQQFFIEPRAVIRREKVSLFQNDEQIAQYAIVDALADVALGLRIGRLGEARAGWRQMQKRASLMIGSPFLPNIDESFGGPYVSIDLDRNDRIFNPRNGWSARASYFEPTHKGYSRLLADLSGAKQLGTDWVVQARVSYQGSPVGVLPIYDVATLGGFFNLTAFAPKQLTGDDASYGGLRIERVLGELPLGLRGDIRLGVALEAGKMGTLYTETYRTGWQNSVALYVGGETPIGPVYIGYGYSPSSGYWNAYLNIGVP
ncbi:MAG: patatin-like phospholipase family protein [Burkholderiaceae bacterium]|nr:patatin-like phospholipase family protein [Burkholderiaceae bacterium]